MVADRDAESASAVAGALGSADVAVPVTADVTSEDDVSAAFASAALAFGGVDLVVNNAGLSISKPLTETTAADWDILHDVMARGSFLVSREAAKAMEAQGMGGDIIYIVSKNGVFAGPANIAYGAAKADQAHQVRLLAAELGTIAVRVNGINPDGVVRGSGIFAGGWGAQRAAVYGVPEEELGAFYAQRTLLKQEVLPEHVAAAVFALTGGDLPLTTGMLIPVDAGRRSSIPPMTPGTRGRQWHIRHWRHADRTRPGLATRRGSGRWRRGAGWSSGRCRGSSGDRDRRRGRRRSRRLRRPGDRRAGVDGQRQAARGQPVPERAGPRRRDAALGHSAACTPTWPPG